eukprot:g12969.t1
MPKRQADEEVESDVEKEEKGKATASKKAKKAVLKKQGDGSGVSNKIELGKNKFVDVREFKGQVLVDIREYYEKDGEMRPGKKGISLTAGQWKALKDNMDGIEAKIEEIAD